MRKVGSFLLILATFFLIFGSISKILAVGWFNAPIEGGLLLWGIGFLLYIISATIRMVIERMMMEEEILEEKEEKKEESKKMTIPNFLLTTQVVKIITDAGYICDSRKVNKNGVEKTAISVQRKDMVENGVVPLFYLEDTEGSTPEEMASNIIIAFGNMERNSETINTLKNFVLTDHLEDLFIGVEATKNENPTVATRSTRYEDVNMYMYCDVMGEAMFKISKAMVASLSNKITEDELFERAIKNTFEKTKIISMLDVLFNQFGIDLRGTEAEQEDMMYIASTADSHRGAAAMLDINTIKEFCLNKGYHKVAILPSSIFEIIIVPVVGTMSKEELRKMVSEINATQVAPEEVLTDNVYIEEF